MNKLIIMDNLLIYSFHKFISESNEIVRKNNNEINWKIIKLKSDKDSFLNALLIFNLDSRNLLFTS